jgi:hypothetical protein
MCSSRFKGRTTLSEPKLSPGRAFGGPLGCAMMAEGIILRTAWKRTGGAVPGGFWLCRGRSEDAAGWSKCGCRSEMQNQERPGEEVGGQLWCMASWTSTAAAAAAKKREENGLGRPWWRWSARGIWINPAVGLAEQEEEESASSGAAGAGDGAGAGAGEVGAGVESEHQESSIEHRALLLDSSLQEMNDAGVEKKRWALGVGRGWRMVDRRVGSCWLAGGCLSSATSYVQDIDRLQTTDYRLQTIDYQSEWPLSSRGVVGLSRNVTVTLPGSSTIPGHLLLYMSRCWRREGSVRSHEVARSRHPSHGRVLILLQTRCTLHAHTHE